MVVHQVTVRWHNAVYSFSRSVCFPWLLAAISFGAFVATYSELVRWRAKFNYMDAWR